MDEQMFMMKSEVVCHLYCVMILLKVLTKKSAKDSASQFQNFWVNFHKFHALFSMRLLVSLGYHKLRARWVLKVLRGSHKMQKMALASTFF
jgi:hypothetical protein